MFTIIYKKSALKELLNLPKEAALKIRIAINELGGNPYPAGCKKLAGNTSAYRIRIGNYRVIYTVDSRKAIILIIKIADRKNVYQ